MRPHILQLLFLLFAISILADPLEFQSQHLYVNDGLPHPSVTDIFQDSQGFLWFGTMGGLARYNGYEFKIFLHDSTDNSSISGNNITTIVEDRSGNLWIGTVDHGLNKYDRRTNTFYHFKYQENDSCRLSSNTIYRLVIDSYNNLWIIHENGFLDRLDCCSEEITCCRHNPENISSPSHSIVLLRDMSTSSVPWWRSQNWLGSTILQDSYGQMWIGTRRGLNLFHNEDDTFVRASHLFGATVLDTTAISSLFEDKQKRLWISTWGQGLFQYDPQSNRLRHFHKDALSPYVVPDNFCYQLFQDNENGLWLYVSSGLSYYDPDGDEFIYLKDPEEPNSTLDFQPFYADSSNNVWAYSSSTIVLIDAKTKHIQKIARDASFKNNLGTNRLSGFFQDRFGSLWFNRHYRGVVKLNPLALQFKHINVDIEGMPQLTVYDIIRSKSEPSKLWLCTSQGLLQYDHERQTLSVAPENKILIKQADKSNAIFTVLEDNENSLWIGTIYKGLYRRKANGHIIRYLPDKHDSTSINSDSIWSIYQDINGVIWIGTNHGVNRYDPERNAFVRYTKNYFQSNPLVSYVNCFCDENKDVLWIGGDGGLYRYSRKQNSFESFLSEFYIVALHRDSKDRIWFGSDNRIGLYLLNKEDGTASVFKPDNADNRFNINFIQEDKAGFLWCSTLGGGLLKFDPEQETFTTFTQQHGLPGNAYSSGGETTTDGTLYFPTLFDGIVSFEPDKIKLNKIPPQILITDILVNGVSIAIGRDSMQHNITLTQEVNLNHTENDISIEMTALHYAHPAANRYKFWLENFDEDWRDNGTNRVAHYTNLDPGTYIFHAKGANSDGLWNEEPTSLRIIIHPPWWATGWAYGFYLLIIIGIVVTTWKAQIRRIKIRNELEKHEFEAEQLKKIDHLKSRFFTNISHEFRTPMTLVLGPLERWSSLFKTAEAERDYSLMRRNILRLQRLINQLLDLSCLEAGKMELQKSTHDIVKLLNHFVQSFESQARLKGIDLECSSSEPKLVMMVDRDKMEHIIFNLMSNALKFTQNGGAVSVYVEKSSSASHSSDSNEWIDIRVSDSGIGIPQDRLDKIFDRFYQVDDSFVREYEGSGIGLSLTKELVELHGGEISVESTLDLGSTFLVRLPFESLPDIQTKDFEQKENQDWSEDTPAIEEQSGTPSKDKPLILIVEDNADLRFYMSEIIQPHYRFEQAEDGLDGFEKAQALVPDLIISDVMMPKMDGFQLCDKLKRHEITSHIPVILLTARATKESKLEGLETGADDYVIKPFDTDELLVRVKNLIEQRQRLRQKYSATQGFNIHQISVSSMDEQFLEKAIESIEGQLTNFDFNAQDFAQHMALSRSQLHRKLYHLTGLSATEFIRSIRLQHAASLITQKSGSISEIAYSVGFNHLSYFSKCFKNQYGVLPSDY